MQHSDHVGVPFVTDGMPLDRADKHAGDLRAVEGSLAIIDHTIPPEIRVRCGPPYPIIASSFRYNGSRRRICAPRRRWGRICNGSLGKVAHA